MPVAASIASTSSGSAGLLAESRLEIAGCFLPQMRASAACDPTILADSRKASAGVSAPTMNHPYSQKNMRASSIDCASTFLLEYTAGVTTTGERVDQLLKELRLEQGDLAERVGVRQSTISKIVQGRTKNSRHLPRIASVLGVSVDYLLGSADEPTACAPLPDPPPLHVVTLPVVLPSEQALAQMFDTLLELIDQLPGNPDRSERARLLARWLPTGLSQLRDLLPSAATVPPEPRKELAEALATHGPAPQ
jgi:transcriptional regulator with XRE-family HTH domain